MAALKQRMGVMDADEILPPADTPALFTHQVKNDLGDVPGLQRFGFLLAGADNTLFVRGRLPPPVHDYCGDTE